MDSTSKKKHNSFCLIHPMIVYVVLITRNNKTKCIITLNKFITEMIMTDP